MSSLRSIFKVNKNAANILCHERTIRVKRMMQPFILRRRKDQVRLKDLPNKIERIE
ncbi:hypothetical protein BKA62DRAFT_714602 [Auriculariales sp. MPI-PUGE-AT-0066]|nr:hypothetical protein BKA62DRAFT_714602 [Auriculariales sp. MPI-PUGE-AT-0066]